MIDLRSDTVTRPTPEMLAAMVQAEVGDDVYGDDPTVNRLEALAAEKVGKEAALFVPSGTFGNICSIMTHVNRGDEIILERSTHVVLFEVGALAALAGAQCRTLEGERGAMNPAHVEAAIRNSSDIHQPPTALICLENAHTQGAVLPLENMRAIREVAQRHHIPIHLDGARLFNAAAFLKVDVKKITSQCDSVMLCLSKGLCAPVGSLVAGTADFIRKARKNRKMLGGGMRQAGILAAAGILALEEMTARLAEDHQNARCLADGLAKLPGITVQQDGLDINMVYFHFSSTALDNFTLATKLADRGIRVNAPEPGNPWRFVTNHDVSRADVEYVLQQVGELLP